MRKYLVICILFCSSYVFSQTTSTKSKNADSVKIYYESSNRLRNAEKQPFWYVDGKLWHANAITAIDTENIKDIQVNKNSSRNGEVHIILKDPSKVANLVFLSQEIEKHLGKDDTPSIYMMDDKFLKDDLKTYKIKENYILRIEVMTSDDLASLKQSKLKLRVINVVTKSQKNIDKANQIYIRGNPADINKAEF